MKIYVNTVPVKDMFWDKVLSTKELSRDLSEKLKSHLCIKHVSIKSKKVWSRWVPSSSGLNNVKKIGYCSNDHIISLWNFIFTGLHGYQITPNLGGDKQRHRLLLLKTGIDVAPTHLWVIKKWSPCSFWKKSWSNSWRRDILQNIHRI